MARTNNYLIQAAQAKARFLTYDQDRLIAKFSLAADDAYLYATLLGSPYRICRTTGDIQRNADGGWQDGNSYEEVMTLLDLLCDSREDRRISGRWQNMQSFGLQFHRNLLEEKKDPMAEAIPGGDMGYAVELFDGLKIGLLFWRGDEEFLPRLRFLWDANAKMYIRYETMYFAVNLLQRRLREYM